MNLLTERSAEHGGGVAPRRLVLAPVSGAAGVALIVGSLVAGGSTPAADAPVERIVAFYGEHRRAQAASGTLLGVGTLLFLIFALTLAAALRRPPVQASEWPSVLATGGAVLVAVGLSLFAALSLALSQLAGHIEPAALQALHVLSQDLVFPLTLGITAFLLGAGIAVRRAGVMPSWLGSMAVGFGLVAAVPSHVLGGVLDHVGFLAFGGLCLWTLLVGGELGVRTNGRSAS